MTDEAVRGVAGRIGGDSRGLPAGVSPCSSAWKSGIGSPAESPPKSWGRHPMAKSKQPAQVYQLKITLRDIKPPVWRRVQVKDSTLAKLHDIIQTCMGWSNSHLHAFEVGGEQYGEPDPDGMMETEDERKVKLSRVVGQGYKKFTYTYDFGDNWEHVVQVEKTLPAETGVRYPRCIAGKR